MAYVTPNDATVVVLTGNAGWLTSVANLQSALVSGVAQWFRVQTIAIPDPRDYVGTWDYTATLRLVAIDGSTYNNPDDVGSVAASVAFDATGYMPSVRATLVPGGARDASVPAPPSTWSLSLPEMVGLFMVGIVVILALTPRAAHSVGLS